MLTFLKRLFASGSAGSDGDSQLAAQSQIQTLRLQLEERDKAFAQLKAELERHRGTVQGQTDEAARTRSQRLMQNAAAAAAQLALQGHLLESEGKPVQARDVLAVARSLLRTLENEGLKLENQPGQLVSFDPNRHEPLSTDTQLFVGQPARIKLPELSFQGALLRKAGVVPEGK
jgi:molecular chaperone GrpE (heat shock protein)